MRFALLYSNVIHSTKQTERTVPSDHECPKILAVVNMEGARDIHNL